MTIAFKGLIRSPVLFVAYGFGAGLAPKAPGTFGTLVAIPVYILLHNLSTYSYLAVLVFFTLVGIWICGKAAKEVGVDDPSGIVWDEIVGLLFVFIALPFSWMLLVFGFLLFRLFDILKPWPICWLDKTLRGGLGIVVDDVLAGISSCAVLHLMVYFQLITL